MKKAKKFLSKLLNIFLVLTMFMLSAPRHVHAVSPDIVISQVYGGGGNSGATFTNDFIELFNRGTSSVSLAGWSVQYASATGTGNFGSSTTMLTELPSVTLAPGQYLLVQEAQGTGGTTPLPTPDASGSIAMSGTAGKVALVMSTTSLGCNGGSTPCNSTQLALIKDLVGFGSANFYEGSAAAPVLSNTTSDSRAANGCTDTDDNAADFNAGTVAPRNSASPLNPCGGTPLLVINEIDYDQPSTDYAEFVEIINKGTGSADLSEYTLELVNGTGGGASVYQSYTLPSIILAPGGYFVICGDSANVSNCDLDVIPDSNLVQNGAPDAVGLRHNSDLVDAVSYEGNTGAPYTEGTGTGLEDPGTTGSDNMGISRYPDGTDTDINNVDLSLRCSTPGEANIAASSDCVPPNTNLVINEIDYDQPSTDTAEFIEIRNNGDSSTDLAGWTLELVNGNGGGAVPYSTIDLSGFTLPAGDYFVVCANAATVSNCDLDVSPNTDLIQNGAPDAVALKYNSTLIDTVSYEGDTGAPYTEGSGVGLVDAGVDGSISRCPDGVDTDLNNVDFVFASTITPGAENSCTPPPPPEACGDAFTNIYDVQGSGASSPLVGTEVAVEGIVVGDFQNNGSVDNGNLNGFHIQDPTGDGNPATSDGIFIYASSAADVSNGDIVRVRGNVSEYNGLTEISASQVWPCSTGNTLPAPATVSLPVTNVGDFEAYEGMYVTFPQALVISEYYNFGRYGEIVLTSQRHLTPSAEFEPGPAAIQAAADFLLDKITLDDGRSTQNPDPAIHPNGNVFDLTNLFRGGDTVQNVTGIMDYSFSLYRIQPTQGADYIAANPRPSQPEAVGGTLKVASFNVLNYFYTIDTGKVSEWNCGPSQDMECRGADTDEEFTRQRDKTIAALQVLNADVVGVFEIENNVNDDALKDLVDGLNAKIGSVTYAYVDTGAIGTDAIKVAIIYKPAIVSLVGNFAILDTSVDPRFLDTKNRPSLAQSFKENSSNDVFTLVVNHLKSKGSDCNDVGDPDTGDGSGNCNITRTLAAQALVDWLESDPTNSGDSDYLIIGDLNSYDKEDPIDAILAGPDDVLGTGDDYTDLVFSFQGEDAYSYVFDGQTGYLDHALASATLADQIMGLTDWHINADEPSLIDYDMDFKFAAQVALYENNPYRSSDHDPVIVGLDLTYQMTPIAEVCPEGLTISKYGYTVTIPPGAVSECVDIYVENESTSAGPALPDGYLSLDYRVQILIKKTSGIYLTSFNPPLEVCINYTDEDLAKVGFDPNYLKIWTAQKGATAWQILATTPYPAQKRVCAQVSHLSYFDLLFAPGFTPDTGFAPNRVTSLPVQTEAKSYTSLGNLWVEIPRIGVNVAITGVPFSSGEWDVSWLNNQIGWLEGTAFPSWDGNSVLTGHVYEANGLPGPFVNLSQLWYGDQIIIHAFGESHVYEIQTIFQVKPEDVKSILKHEDESWLTLVTCRGYDPVNDTYQSRYIIRAINVDNK